MGDKPWATGQGFIFVKNAFIHQWKCVHIAITKNPFLDRKEYNRQGDCASEQSGYFSLYHPAVGDTSCGALQLWGEPEFTNGLLVVRMRPMSTLPPRQPQPHPEPDPQPQPDPQLTEEQIKKKKDLEKKREEREKADKLVAQQLANEKGVDWTGQQDP